MAIHVAKALAEIDPKLTGDQPPYLDILQLGRYNQAAAKAHKQHQDDEDYGHGLEEVDHETVNRRGHSVGLHGDRMQLHPDGRERLELFQPTIFGLILAIIFAIIMRTATRKMTLVPGKLQNVIELVVGGLYDFLAAIVGERGKHLVPFLGTLFLYIWLMNFMGLIPFMMSPTSHFRMTVALAISVFLYVQWTGVRQNGPARFPGVRPAGFP